MGDAIASGDVQSGIIICGTGIGISIAANRNPAVRCGLCTDTTMARLTREHNDANVLAVGARITGVESAMDIVDVFLNTEFEGGRHARRVEKLG
jgi:ribose 5-phosphate isomerase B